MLLINGRREPVLEIAAGQIERWRIVNASSARYVRLSLGGRPFRIIGTDGGLREAPVTVTEVLLAAGERVELAVGRSSEGAEIAIESLPYRRTHDQAAAKTERVRHAACRRRAQPSRPSIPAALRDDRAARARGPTPPTRSVRLRRHA